MAKAAAGASAKPGKDVIYVDVDDEITSIIDKVESSKQKVVALVLPKRMASLQSIVNMRLLKRSAGHGGKSVVLITSESALLPLAGAAGIHVAKNLQSLPAVPDSPLVGTAHHHEPDEEEVQLPESEAGDNEDLQKSDLHKPIGALATAHEEPEQIDLDNDTTPSAASGESLKKGHKNKSKLAKVPNISRMRLFIFGGLGALILLILLFVLASTAFTKATITVTTTSTPVSLNTNLTASGGAKTLDVAGKVIPSVLKTSNQTATQQATATGTKNLGDKAGGSVSMTAQKCSGNPFVAPDDVPAGTGVSSGGLGFITQSSVSFHGTGVSGNCFTYAGNASVNITAQSPGAKYNLQNATFTVPGRSDVSASGSASGGSDNNVTVLQQSDVDAAAAKVGSSNAAGFEQNFQNQLASQGYYVFTTTMQAATPATTANPAVGQQATTAQVTITITYSVLAVQKSDLTTFVTDALNKQIDQKKEKISDSDVLNGLTIAIQNQNQADATLVLSKNTTAVPILDAQSIKSFAAGKKSGDIQTYINTYPGVKNVDVSYSPFWISKAPKSPAKIKIVQKQVKSGS